MGIRAIETRYKGYRFRSRLEARYAVFFDALGIPWEYETEGYELGELGRYLPDFWLPIWNVFAEVKPERFTEEEFNKSAALPHACLLLDGAPDVRHYFITGCHEELSSARWYEDYLGTDHEGFGTVNLEWSLAKGRLWFDYGEGVKAYHCDMLPAAVGAARSARFEHGESGAA